MLTFDPPALKDEVAAAIKVIGELLTIDWYSEDGKDFDPAEFADRVITPSTLLENSHFRSSGHHFSISIKDFCEWADLFQKSKLIDRTTLQAEGYILVHVDAENEKAFSLQYNAFREEIEGPLFHLDTEIEYIKYSVSLRWGPTPFALHVENEGWNDADMCPSCDPQDCFVEVVFPRGIISVADSLVDSFLYELSSSANLVYNRGAYIRHDGDDPEEEAEATLEHAKSSVRLRPLLTGPGMQDLLVLFNDALAAKQVEFQLLGYSKVIEYISATVTRQATHNVLRARLESSDALHPNAGFIDDLITLIDDQREYRKDAEAIRLAIETCCDAVVLASESPGFIRSLKAIKGRSKADEKRKALQELAECLYATRNQIVHAKTNYSKKGKECPDSELVQFSACIRIACDQAIRWFASVPPEFRIHRDSES